MRTVPQPVNTPNSRAQRHLPTRPEEMAWRRPVRDRDDMEWPAVLAAQ